MKIIFCLVITLLGPISYAQGPSAQVQSTVSNQTIADLHSDFQFLKSKLISEFGEDTMLYRAMSYIGHVDILRIADPAFHPRATIIAQQTPLRDNEEPQQLMARLSNLTGVPSILYNLTQTARMYDDPNTAAFVFDRLLFHEVTSARKRIALEIPDTERISPSLRAILAKLEVILENQEVGGVPTRSIDFILFTRLTGSLGGARSSSQIRAILQRRGFRDRLTTLFTDAFAIVNDCDGAIVKPRENRGRPQE